MYVVCILQFKYLRNYLNKAEKNMFSNDEICRRNYGANQACITR
jgi:hypothetical protein